MNRSLTPTLKGVYNNTTTVDHIEFPISQKEKTQNETKIKAINEMNSSEEEKEDGDNNNLYSNQLKNSAKVEKINENKGKTVRFADMGEQPITQENIDMIFTPKDEKELKRLNDYK